MKLWKLGPINGSVLLALVGAAMVTAASVMLVSNVLTVNVTVTENPVQIDPISVETEYPDLSGSVAKGQTYEMSVEIASNASVGMCEFEVNITKAGISIADVSVQRLAGASWEPLTLIQGDGYAYVRLPDVAVSDGYYDVETFAFTFAVAGDYDVNFAMYAVSG